MGEIQQGMGGTGERKVDSGPNWQKIMMPIVGLILLVLGGVVGFLLSKPATDFLRTRVANFPKQPEMQYVVGVGIFLILLLVLYIVFAAIAPKPKATTNEAALDKEKKEKLEEMARVKRRNAEMKQRMKQANRKKNSGE
jgi:type VI protein secretion system component VasK